MDGSYSVSYIHSYFQYIIKKHEKVTYNPPIRIYVNKIENKIRFLELLMPETVKPLGSTKDKIKMMEVCLIQESQKQYQATVTLLTMIINMIQEFSIHFSPINRLPVIRFIT